MARAAQSRRRNFPGFGWLTKKQTTYKRSRGEASHSTQAYRAGVKSGDTGGFDSWLKRKGLERASGSVQKSLEAAYRRGVERSGVAERVKAAKAERSARKKERKQTALSSYKGVRLYKVGGGEYTTSIDKESRFDSLQDAKDFIRSWKEDRNPGCARTRKSTVTDRARRYRANQRGCKPAGVKKCRLCGKKSDLMVDHIDGNESNGSKRNLRWLCRSCNTLLGAEMARTGQGRRTVQYNPQGAQTLREYMLAVLQHTRGAHDEAGRLIHETPKWKRKQYASEIWAARKARGNPAQARNPAMEFSTEYHLGYNLGQADRQSAQLRKTANELHAAFAANFGPGNSLVLPSWESFEQAYQAGYGGQMGAAAPNPEIRPENIRVVPSTRRAGMWDVIVRGIHRMTKPTRKGAEGYAKQIRGANPETPSEEYEQARKIAELFHGRPVKEEITVTESIREHDWLWRIGPLVKLKVKTVTKQRATFPFSQKGEALVHLMCSPDGRQMYLRSGDQELDLKALGMEQGTKWYRDRMVIGQVTELTYRDSKRFQKFVPTDYYHALGEETKVKPWLVYDTMNKHLEILGGQYHVETEELTENMSPGIVN